MDTSVRDKMIMAWSAYISAEILQGFRSIVKASMDRLTVRREEETGEESRETTLICRKKGSIARGFSNMAYRCGISRCQSS
jgi:hypothetical protein